eukprot:Lankesteria_metandrocarpae@DN8574_c0_g1_i1.p1
MFFNRQTAHVAHPYSHHRPHAPVGVQPSTGSSGDHNSLNQTTQPQPQAAVPSAINSAFAQVKAYSNNGPTPPVSYLTQDPLGPNSSRPCFAVGVDQSALYATEGNNRLRGDQGHSGDAAAAAAGGGGGDTSALFFALPSASNDSQRLISAGYRGLAPNMNTSSNSHAATTAGLSVACQQQQHHSLPRHVMATNPHHSMTTSINPPTPVRRSLFSLSPSTGYPSRSLPFGFMGSSNMNATHGGPPRWATGNPDDPSGLGALVKEEARAAADPIPHKDGSVIKKKFFVSCRARMCQDTHRAALGGSVPDFEPIIEKDAVVARPPWSVEK